MSFVGLLLVGKRAKDMVVALCCFVGWCYSKKVKRWKGEKVKRWKGEKMEGWKDERVKRLKGWKGEKVKRWKGEKMAAPTKLVNLLVHQLVN